MVGISEGVIVGAFAGVAAGLVLWSIQAYVAKREKEKIRRSQIAFLRTYLQASFHWIIDPDEKDEHVPLFDQANFDLYGYMLRGLQGVADRGTGGLSHFEASALQMTITRQKHARESLQALYFDPQTRVPIGWYRQRYEEFQRLPWIELPVSPTLDYPHPTSRAAHRAPLWPSPVLGYI